MNKFLLTLLLSCVSFVVFAQSVLITGKVVVDDGIAGQDAINNILVQNQTTNAETMTSPKGIFSIKVSVGDELIFTHDFYKERTIKITTDILTKGMLTVHLNIETIELAEANILTLDKNWKQNIKIKETSQTKMYNSLGLDPNMQYYKVNPNATSSLNNNGILDPALWISTISGQKKKDKKLDQYFKKVNKIKDVENYFTTNYFVESLNIPENKVSDFVTYCYANFELEKLIKENNYDKITQIFEDNAPKYLEMIKKKS